MVCDYTIRAAIQFLHDRLPHQSPPSSSAQADAAPTSTGLYARTHPDEIRFVAVAETQTARARPLRRPASPVPEHQFETWEPLLALPQLADAAFVCTQDEQHTAPALAQRYRAGYHVLLEKPMATTAEECIQLVQTSEETGRRFASPTSCATPAVLFKLREIIRSGRRWGR